MIPLAKAYPPLACDPRDRSLDAWRGVACLAVVLHHAGFAVVLTDPGGSGWDGDLRRAVVGLLWRMNLGVPLFFVISGYCIAASADSHRRRGSGPLGFLFRRVWRIYPPYWSAFAFFAILTAGLGAAGLERWYHGDGSHALQLDAPDVLEPVQWVGNLTLTEEWRPLVWRPPPKLVYTRIAWSLCYEEQFYLITFAALLVARRRLFVTLGLVTLVAGGLRAFLGDIGALAKIDGSFPLLWHEFAVGIAVYVHRLYARSSGQRRAIELGLVGLFALGLGVQIGSSPVEFSTSVAAAFGLALIILRSREAWIAGTRALGWLRAAGRRCYSIYLIHLPVCTVGNLVLFELGITGFWPRVLVTIPVVSAGAVAVSWAFFAAIERHFLNAPILGRPGAGPPAAGVSGLAPAVASG